MEALYLLCSIAATSIISSFLSLAFAFRSLFLLPRTLSSRKPGGATSGGGGEDPAVVLYEGRVRHTRRRPVFHSFEYPVRYALIDLDRAPQQPSHLSAERARQVAGTDGPVLLLTIPANMGYEQNPLSVYYCYNMLPGAQEEEEEEGRDARICLRMCIAEVTNTPWGERVSFLFSPGSDLVAKPLHVSPFMDMHATWRICADAPGEDLSLSISVQHMTLGNYFTATLCAKRVYSSSDSLSLEAFFWLMPHKIAMWIYWQALKLWWKNVSFLSHPKYHNPGYRDDALRRNKEIRCSYNAVESKGLPSCTNKLNNKDWWCVWREAPWPWS